MMVAMNRVISMLKPIISLGQCHFLLKVNSSFIYSVLLYLYAW